MRAAELFFDLIAVPGLTGVILFDGYQTPVLQMVGQTAAPAAGQENMLRSVGQIVRQLRGVSARVELRCAQGRFILRSLEANLSIACITNHDINLPLLKMALDGYAEAALQERENIVETFRRGEVAALFEQISATTPPLTLHSLRSFRSLRDEALQTLNGNGKPQTPPPSPTPPPATPVREEAALSLSGVPKELATVGRTVMALNQISEGAVAFLGKSVVANYWRKTQPEDWRTKITVTLDGRLAAQQPDTYLAWADWLAICGWVRQFSDRCAMIVVDLPLELSDTLDTPARLLWSGEVNLITGSYVNETTPHRAIGH